VTPANVAPRAAVCALALLPLQQPRERATTAAAASPRVTAIRLRQNPLITVDTSPSLGDNVNGPAIIRVPSWIPHALGRYYAYFGHHKGHFIRLAYADAIAGPWTVYTPGVVPVRDTAFFRPQPDLPDGPTDQFYTHVASPEVFVDEGHTRLVMWTHGWWTDGRWPHSRWDRIPSQVVRTRIASATSQSSCAAGRCWCSSPASVMRRSAS
jgi:hypothetical protein